MLTEPERDFRSTQAAENDHGNDPDQTEIATLVPGQSYKVTVGSNNPDDGAHT